MKAGHPRRALFGVALVVLAGAWTLPAHADERPALVTYGGDAPTREGDFYGDQTIYISVPEDSTGRLWINVFDPGIGPAYDKPAGPGRTRYAVFGGPAAFSLPPVAPADPPPEAAAAGTLIAERVFGNEPDAVGQWKTVAVVDPSQGDAVDGRRIFRLLVQGLEGAAGNVFDVAVSARGTEPIEPEGLEIFAYRLTVRAPDPKSFAELRFHPPAGADRLVVHGFDLAYGTLDLTTAFSSVPLKASGQDRWRATEIALDPRAGGAMAALDFGRGVETPNDATFMIADAAGKPVRFELPVRLWPALVRPKPAVDRSDLAACGSVSFDAGRSVDPKGGHLTYRWDFGDGSAAEGPLVRHDYRAPGRYKARLEVLGSSAKIGDGAATDFTVDVKTPPDARIASPASAATGAEVAFDGSGSVADRSPIRHRTWRFSDGTTLKGAKVSRRFDAPGRYLASLTVDDGSGRPCGTDTTEASILVNTTPVAVLGPDRRASVGEDVAFDARRSFDADGRITAYAWDFDDGTRSDAARPAHAYDRPGTYIVRLTVADDAGLPNSMASATTSITVNAPPTSVAGADQSAAVGEPLVFDGSASSDPDGRLLAWDWDFGDGQGGAGEQATHAFSRPGIYRVRLTVRDDSGTSSATGESTLRVRVNDPPVAVAGPDLVVTASAVAFDGIGSFDRDDAIAEYAWDFGDGGTGTGSRPTHVYETPGRYPVRLTVTDRSGTKRNSASDTMTVVVNARPVADPGPDRIVAPGEKVVFDGSRSLDPDGDIADYRWDFRDGSEGKGRIASHGFARPGVYDVRLAVTDDSGDADAVDYKEARITVNAAPVADLGGDLIAAPGDIVRLSAASSYDPDGRIVSYRWDFGDDAPPISTAQVERTFSAPGLYTARLTVADDSGASNGFDSREIKIAVNHAPVADAGPEMMTESLIVSFDGTASTDPDGDALTYRWDFGDGTSAIGARAQHTYAAAGTYPIILVVDDGKGLGNSIGRIARSLVIHQPPIANAGGNREVCTGDAITFDGSKSLDPQGGALRYAWDFGDGTASDIVNPTKTYRKAGVYPVTLAVKDSANLPNSAHADRVSIKVDQGASANAGPDIEACAMSPVDFDASRSFDPNGTIKRYDWDFGDGKVAVGEKPSHAYERPGDYRVFLKIEGQRAGRCDPHSTDEMSVRILAGPVVKIDARNAAPLGEIAFDGSGSDMQGGKITGWHWDFGDGGTAEGATVRHVFTEPGRKTVTLTLASDSASPTCRRVSGTHVLDINAPPIAVMTAPESLSEGEELLLDAGRSHDPDGAIAAYSWDFGDGGTATGVQVNHRFTAAGTYKVRLTVTDDAGVENSSATVEQILIVRPPPTPDIDLPVAACTGEDVHLVVDAAAKPADGGWRDAGETDGGHTFVRRFEQPGRYDVTVITDDGRDLAGSRRPKTRILHVNRPPVAMPGPQRTVCPMTEVAFDGTSSYDADGRIVRYQWDFGDGNAAQGPKVTHVFETPGTYDIALTVTDDTESSCAATRRSARIVVNAPPVADAGPPFEAFVGGAADAVLLDGTRSRDPDGGALTHVWRVGDGTIESGERVRHLFRQTGDVPVELTVTDSSGLSCGQATDRTVVTVRRRSPMLVTETPAAGPRE
ncbi:PKD domain-containing protein [Mycobacterium sp. KBS0706]|uniref:PKD domain-containing protein n=1 Tax=Mycobacterium sp. KBS0706 TaxID=2578109 RepID=UPI00110FD88E|nr:PKD domain-containing protein [Mycobacterium sp. KBS0706]TSD87204.1 PKD domain-containing protein [Mycobacterium sp. KBS0706]